MTESATRAADWPNASQVKERKIARANALTIILDMVIFRRCLGDEDYKKVNISVSRIDRIPVRNVEYLVCFCEGEFIFTRMTWPVHDVDAR